jgi:outer membrane murein-binding lipoprotein Lpp
MKKGIATIFAVVITVVVMALLAGGGWYYLDQSFKSDKSELNRQINALEENLQSMQNQLQEQKTNSNQAEAELSDRNTYASEEYGYSFNYPVDFSLVDWLWDGLNDTRVPSDGRVVWVSDSILPENSIPLDAGPISQYFSISVSDRLCQRSDLEFEGVTVNEEQFLDQSAWRRQVINPEDAMGGNFETSIHVNRGAYCYIITWVNSDSAGSHDSQIDEMVDSFKFI